MLSTNIRHMHIYLYMHVYAWICCIHLIIYMNVDGCDDQINKCDNNCIEFYHITCIFHLLPPPKASKYCIYIHICNMCSFIYIVRCLLKISCDGDN